MTNQILSGTGASEEYNRNKLLLDRTYLFTADVPVRVAFRKDPALTNVVSSSDLLLNAGQEYRFKIDAGDGWGSYYVYCEAADGVSAYNLTIDLLYHRPDGRFDKYDLRVGVAPCSDIATPSHRSVMRLSGTGNVAETTTTRLMQDRRYLILNGDETVVCNIGDSLQVTLQPYGQYEFVASNDYSYKDSTMYVSVVAQDGVSAFETFVIQKA